MKKKLSLLLIVLLLTAGGSVSALSTYDPYSTVVPKFNGMAFTGTQYKNGHKTPADLKVTTLGKPVDANSFGSGVSGPWVRISALGSYSIPDPNTTGDYTSIAFSNDLTTYVDVLVVGEFRNN